MSKLADAINRLDRYMSAANSVGHSAAQYQDQDGNTYILFFNDLEVVIDAAERYEDLG